MGAGSRTIPGVGTYFVGIDIVPGHYRCDDGKNGWWVRFTGSGGDQPVGLWPLPAGPTEVVISDTDFAFETHVPKPWRLVTPTVPGSPAERHELRPVVEPGLRDELDQLVARRGPLGRIAPMAAVLIALLGMASLGVWVILPLLPLVVLGFYSSQMAADVRRARALKLRRDRYLVPEDFDAQGRALLTRVQAAVTTVMESRVHREGLLDTVDNTVTLPRQEWEIAQVLVRQSKLRAEQEGALAAGVPEVAAALRPLREKLDLSVRAVTRRIEALERYADRARAADEVLHAQRQLDALTDRAHAYDELLAETVRDEMALPAIERLADHGEQLLASLRERLAEAAEAAEAAAAAGTAARQAKPPETGSAADRQDVADGTAARDLRGQAAGPLVAPAAIEPGRPSGPIGTSAAPEPEAPAATAATAEAAAGGTKASGATNGSSDEAAGTGAVDETSAPDEAREADATADPPAAPSPPPGDPPSS